MMCLNCACLYSAHVWVWVCVKGDVLPPQILVVSSGGNDGGKILRNGKRINWIIRAGNGKKVKSSNVDINNDDDDDDGDVDDGGIFGVGREKVLLLFFPKRVRFENCYFFVRKSTEILRLF